MPHLKRPIREFARNSSGSIFMMFALMLPVSLLLIGLVIDLSEALSLRKRAQLAADAAVLAATSNNVADGADRAAIAKDVFLANLGDPEPLNEFSFDFSKANGAATGTIAYSLRHKTSFGKLAGIGAWQLGGQSQAGTGNVTISRAETEIISRPKPVHYEIEFWVDISGSMLIAADEQSRYILQILSGADPGAQYCAFACHLHPTVIGGGTPYDRALARGIPLRFTVVKSAILNLIRSLEARETYGTNIQYRLATLGTRFEYQTGYVSASTMITAVEKLAPEPANRSELLFGQNFWEKTGSRLSTTIGKGAKSAPEGLDGSSSSAAKRLVVIATDGMQFQWQDSDVPRSGPIDATVCDPLKSKDVKVAVVHTPYIDLTGVPLFEEAVNKWGVPRDLNLLIPPLKACASPGLYYEANETAAINNAFNSLIEQIVIGQEVIVRDPQVVNKPLTITK